MITDNYQELGYAVITLDDPFLVITVKHANLVSYVTIGDGFTGIKVYRVDKDYDFRLFAPIEVKADTYKFVFDALFFAVPGGRYEYEFFYKGHSLGKKQFVYHKPKVEFLGT